MREQQLLELDVLCRSRGITLLIVRSYGLMGYMRVSHGGVRCAMPCFVVRCFEYVLKA